MVHVSEKARVCMRCPGQTRTRVAYELMRVEKPKFV